MRCFEKYKYDSVHTLSGVSVLCHQMYYSQIHTSDTDSVTVYVYTIDTVCRVTTPTLCCWR